MKKFSFIFVLLSIIILGGALRIYKLGKQSIWFDEASAFFRTNKTPYELWINQLNESSPALYDFLLHYWVKFFGGKEFQLRLLSAIFGILLIPLAFIAGKYMFNNKVGLFSSLLVAISPYHIYYSQEAKMYTLLPFLSLLSFFIFYLALTRFKLIYWTSYVFISILLIYCHNHGVILVFTQFLIFIIFYRKQKINLRKFLLSNSIIVLFCIPRIECLSKQIFMDMDPWVRSPKVTDIIKTFVHFSLFSWRMPFTILVYTVLIIGIPIFLILFLNAVLGKDRQEASVNEYFTKSEKKLFLLSYLFIPIAIAFLISLKKSSYVAGRYDISFYPAFFLLISIGLDKIRKNTVRHIFISCMFLLSMFYLYSYYFVFKKSGDRVLAQYLQSNVSKKNVFLFTELSFGAFRYYWKGDLPKNVFIFPAIEKAGYIPRWAIENEDSHMIEAIKKLKKEIYPLLDEGNSLWVMYVNMSMTQRLIEELSKDLENINTINFDSGINDCQVCRIYIFKKK